jgi:hypothetical protein
MKTVEKEKTPVEFPLAVSYHLMHHLANRRRAGMGNTGLFLVVRPFLSLPAATVLGLGRRALLILLQPLR